MKSFSEKLINEGFNISSLKEGQSKMKCPSCSHTRKKNKSDTCLSFSLDSQGAKWNCHHCDWTGNVWRNDDSSYPESFKQTKPKFKDDIETYPLTEEFLDWFVNERKIEKRVLDIAEVRCANTFIGGKKQKAIAFLHRNNGQTTNIKFRTLDKSFSQTPNGTRLPYLWSLVDQNEDKLIIVEGEMDALACMSAGLNNVISVPDGAGDKKMSWLESLHDELKSFKQIILFTDDDKQGIELREELARRLGKVRCWKVSLPSGHKDANDMLNNGKVALLDVVDNATPYPLKDLRETHDFMENALRLLHGDVRTGLSTGIKAMDGNADGSSGAYRVRAGELTLVSGVPNGGKSELLDAIILSLAKSHAHRFAICSFENPVDEHINKLVAKLVGKPTWDVASGNKVRDDEWYPAVEFIQEHFYWIRSEDEPPTIEWCLNTASNAVQRYPNLRGLVLDPYNEFEHKRPSGYTETEYVSLMLAQIKRWASTHGVHVWLVAHPTKLRRNMDGSFPTPTAQDISGSANFYNKCDNLLIVERDFTPNSNDVRVHVKKIRFRQSGRLGVIELKYDANTGRYS